MAFCCILPSRERKRGSIFLYAAFSIKPSKNPVYQFLASETENLKLKKISETAYEKKIFCPEKIHKLQSRKIIISALTNFVPLKIPRVP